jgi:uncharacterized protein
MNSIVPDFDTKYRMLRDRLAELGRVAVAFSGGTDSSLLLAVAGRVLGDDVLAVTVVSETTPRRERATAIRLARDLGVEHRVLQVNELEDPAFVSNPPDKCYICKKARFGRLLETAAECGFRHVADGENADDVADYRPGSRAARELGVRSPLREAGLTKAEVRRLSHRLELPNWDRPASACLASRIPYHQPITAEKLQQIDEGEEFLRSLGLTEQVRVRHEGRSARIEVEEAALPDFLETSVRRRLMEKFRGLGFSHVALDLEGYRTGSLNRGIVPENEGNHHGS